MHQLTLNLLRILAGNDRLGERSHTIPLGIIQACQRSDQTRTELIRIITEDAVEEVLDLFVAVLCNEHLTDTVTQPLRVDVELTADRKEHLFGHITPPILNV